MSLLSPVYIANIKFIVNYALGHLVCEVFSIFYKIA